MWDCFDAKEVFREKMIVGLLKEEHDLQIEKRRFEKICL
jgi:hypothetical protein